jgi:hypothetical protein
LWSDHSARNREADEQRDRQSDHSQNNGHGQPP